MGDAEEGLDELGPEPRHEARERICLMCGDPFPRLGGSSDLRQVQANVRRSGAGYSLEG